MSNIVNQSEGAEIAPNMQVTVEMPTAAPEHEVVEAKQAQEKEPAELNISSEEQKLAVEQKPAEVGKIRWTESYPGEFEDHRTKLKKLREALEATRMTVEAVKEVDALKAQAEETNKEKGAKEKQAAEAELHKDADDVLNRLYGELSKLSENAEKIVEKAKMEDAAIKEKRDE